MKKRLLYYTRNRKKVYIIPTSNGFRYIVINFFMFLIAMAYANNMALLITFAMFSFLIIQMFATHKIINDLNFDKLYLDNSFADEDSSITTYFKKDLPPNSSAYIKIKLEASTKKLQAVFHEQATSKTLHFKLIKKERGKYQLERIHFFTTGPANLFYVWRYAPIEQTLYIYPSKIVTKNPFQTQNTQAQSLQEGSEFREFVRYQSGMSAKRIDWKKYAAKDELFWKKQNSLGTEISEVNYHLFEGEKEHRLSKMSYLCLQYSKANVVYALKTPKHSIDANSGHQHFLKTLEAISEL